MGGGGRRGSRRRALRRLRRGRRRRCRGCCRRRGRDGRGGCRCAWRCRCRGCGRAARADLRLQLRKICVACLKQTARLLQLRFKLVQARLQALHWRRKQRSSCPAEWPHHLPVVWSARSVSPDADGRISLAAAAGAAGWLCQAAYWRRISLSASVGADRLRSARLGDAQHRAGMQQIHVAFKRAGVGLVDGHHPAARACAAGARERACDL